MFIIEFILSLLTYTCIFSVKIFRDKCNTKAPMEWYLHNIVIGINVLKLPAPTDRAKDTI